MSIVYNVSLLFTGTARVKSVICNRVREQLITVNREHFAFETQSSLFLVSMISVVAFLLSGWRNVLSFLVIFIDLNNEIVKRKMKHFWPNSIFLLLSFYLKLIYFIVNKIEAKCHLSIVSVRFIGMFLYENRHTNRIMYYLLNINVNWTCYQNTDFEIVREQLITVNRDHSAFETQSLSFLVSMITVGALLLSNRR